MPYMLPDAPPKRYMGTPPPVPLLPLTGRVHRLPAGVSQPERPQGHEEKKEILAWERPQALEKEEGILAWERPQALEKVEES